MPRSLRIATIKCFQIKEEKERVLVADE
jgi:hypothetical protein